MYTRSLRGDTEHMPRVDSVWGDRELSGPHPPSWHARRAVRGCTWALALALASVALASVAVAVTLMGVIR